jgi:uncharacterized protein YukE
MNGASANLDEMEKFKNVFNNYIKKSSNDINVVKKSFVNLRNTWQDGQAEKFEKSFLEYEKVMKSMINTYENELLPSLNRKIQILKNYTEAR